MARKVPRSIHEAARDKARDIAKTDAYLTSRRERKKVEMLFAHLKRILRLGRLRLRGPCGARDEFLLAATAQNLRKMAKLIAMPLPIPAMEAPPATLTAPARPTPPPEPTFSTQSVRSERSSLAWIEARECPRAAFALRQNRR